MTKLQSIKKYGPVLGKQVQVYWESVTFTQYLSASERQI